MTVLELGQYLETIPHFVMFNVYITYTTPVTVLTSYPKTAPFMVLYFDLCRQIVRPV